MKKAIIGLVGLAALAACTTVPQSAEEMRKVVRGGAFMSDLQSQKVNRNYSAVVRSVRAGAQKCMNRNQSSTSTYSPGPGMAPISTTMVAYYSSDMKSTGGRTELTMRKKMRGAILLGAGEDNSGLVYLVDIAPASGGTQLDFYGGKMGYGDLNKAVMDWARGASTRCPDLP